MAKEANSLSGKKLSAPWRKTWSNKSFSDVQRAFNTSSFKNWEETGRMRLRFLPHMMSIFMSELVTYSLPLSQMEIGPLDMINVVLMLTSKISQRNYNLKVPICLCFL